MQVVPTCQKTSAAVAVPVKTKLPLLMFSALPTWKIKTGLGSVPPANVAVPFNASELNEAV